MPFLLTIHFPRFPFDPPENRGNKGGIKGNIRKEFHSEQNFADYQKLTYKRSVFSLSTNQSIDLQSKPTDRFLQKSNIAGK